MRLTRRYLDPVKTMSKDMQENKKRRAASKGWVTRSVKELQDLFDDDATSLSC